MRVYKKLASGANDADCQQECNRMMQCEAYWLDTTEPTRRAVHLERVYEPPWRDSQQEVALSVAVFSIKSNTVVPMYRCR